MNMFNFFKKEEVIRMAEAALDDEDFHCMLA